MRDGAGQPTGEFVACSPRQSGRETCRPIFLDQHREKGVTAAQIAEMHQKDLAVQDKYGVRFLTYWFDEARHSVFCLIEAPDVESANRAHDDAHGHVSNDMIPVDLSAVEAFLGRVSDPMPDPSGQSPAHDAAFRAVLFTDIVNSTAMTSRLGDIRAVEMVRAHDAIVRRALQHEQGREVKHTGDGIMAAFDDCGGAVRAARLIQRDLNAFNRESVEQLQIRIGIDAGEPVEDSHDLFGATVQTAARICEEAAADAIVISDAVRAVIGAEFPLAPLGRRSFKGIPGEVELFAVPWR